jgi:hypothetical protein
MAHLLAYGGVRPLSATGFGAPFGLVGADLCR